MGQIAKDTKIYFGAKGGFLQGWSATVGEPILVSQKGQKPAFALSNDSIELNQRIFNLSRLGGLDSTLNQQPFSLPVGELFWNEVVEGLPIFLSSLGSLRLQSANKKETHPSPKEVLSLLL